MIPGDKSAYPQSDVLINKFDIRDFAKARAAEYKFASIRETELRLKPLEGKFDFSHLKAIHKHIFQDMYEWAGQVRDIDFAKMSKETGLVTRFVPTVVMDLKVEDLDKFIADKGQLKDLTKPEFVNAITEVQTKLNELHPFREGNGRATRIFLQQLAKEAGFELDLTKIDKNRWNLASAQGVTQVDPKNEATKTLPNQGDMRQIFHESIKPTIAHAFTTEARAEAIKLYPDLGQVYDRVEAIQRYASKLSDPDAGKRLVDAEKGRIFDKLKAGIIPPLNPYLQGRLSNQATRQATTSLASARNIIPNLPQAAKATPARLRM